MGATRYLRKLLEESLRERDFRCWAFKGDDASANVKAHLREPTLDRPENFVAQAEKRTHVDVVGNEYLEARLLPPKGSTQPGVILRMTRQARVPSWAAERKGASTGPTFPVQAVDPAVLSRLVTSLPTTIGRPGVPVSFRIERLGQMATPVITFDVGGQKVVTTLGGTDITDVIGG